MCDTVVKFGSLSIECVELSSKCLGAPVWVISLAWKAPGLRREPQLSPRLQSRAGLERRESRVSGLLVSLGLRVSGLRPPGVSWPASLGSQASWSILAAESQVSGLLVSLGLRVSGLRLPGLSWPPSLGSQASWFLLASKSRVSGLLVSAVPLGCLFAH